MKHKQTLRPTITKQPFIASHQTYQDNRANLNLEKQPQPTKTPVAKATDTKGIGDLSHAQGKSDTQQYKGLMRPRGDVLLHPAGPTLLEYATKGCPVDCGPKWSRERIKKAIAKGPSKSARDPEAARCCREEALQKVAEGHC